MKNSVTKNGTPDRSPERTADPQKIAGNATGFARFNITSYLSTDQPHPARHCKQAINRAGRCITGHTSHILIRLQTYVQDAACGSFPALRGSSRSYLSPAQGAISCYDRTVPFLELPAQASDPLCEMEAHGHVRQAAGTVVNYTHNCLGLRLFRTASRRLNK